MRQAGTIKKQTAKVIRVKKPVAKLPKNKLIVPLPTALER